jgi:hypothetical protein
MISLQKAAEQIKFLKSNFRRTLHVDDTAKLIVNHKGFRHWTDEDLEIVMERLMRYDNYPENLLVTMEEIYGSNHKKVNFLRDCCQCNNTGYRYYSTLVRNGDYDFKNKRKINAKRVCVAACGCDHGRLRTEREEIPWFNDVIKRPGVEEVEDNKQERIQNLLGPLKQDSEENTEDGDEELPFDI